ncbi:hypothetical protein MTE01_28650 [Microbacterium testaceum]|uniref:Uncharacterized protein n=1 Tax=Microbacterium testaceum TaxID=2033 RepID=A0A4Y3QS97_MICTE|nr:hypothetical protein [Microbacterium testaceum]GEB46920.1 hypothetical protein MTE01_28650 [Microbacterium testaceum]
MTSLTLRAAPASAPGRAVTVVTSSDRASLIVGGEVTVEAHAGRSRDLDAIVAAWQDAGPVPSAHARAKYRLRRSWPTLANALDRAAST